MLKKAGLLTVGITAGLLAVAPIASAGEYEGDHSDRDSSHDKDYDGDHDKKHHDDDEGDDWGHDDDGDGDQNGTGNIKCDAEGGEFEANNAASLANVGPVLSGNTGQLLSCNAFLNDVLSDNEVNVLSAP